MNMTLNLKNINKTISSLFPRLQQNHFLESSIDYSYNDVYTPINNYSSDRFIEFRLPKSHGVFTDMSALYLKFNLNVKKLSTDGSEWGSKERTAEGDHYDLSQAIAYSLFSHLSIELNGLQICNENNYALLSYIRLITQFPMDEIDKIGRLMHLEIYDKIIPTHESDGYFTGLSPTNAIAIRLKNIRDYGISVYAPLITDVCQINSYLLDDIEMGIKLSIHDDSTIFITHQYNSDVEDDANGKKYVSELSNVSLHVKKIKPTENSYNALQKTITPNNNQVPYINYVYTSKLSRQFHLPAGQNG